MKKYLFAFALLFGLGVQAASPPTVTATYWDAEHLASMAAMIPQFASAPQNVQVFVFGPDVAYLVRIDYTDKNGQRQAQAHVVLAGDGTTFLSVDNITNLITTATPLVTSGNPVAIAN